MVAQATQAPRVRPLLVLGDTAGLALAIFASHLLRFSSTSFAGKWRSLLETPGLLAWALVSCWVLSAAAEIYEPELIHHFREVAIRALVVVVAWSASMALATYLWLDWRYGRGLLALTAALWSPMLLANRYYFSSWLRTRRRSQALVVGDHEAVEKFCRQLADHPTAPWQPIDGSGVPLVEVKRKVEELGVKLIVVAGTDTDQLRKDLPAELSALHFCGVPVVAAVDLWASIEERLRLETMAPELFLHQPGFGAVHWNPLHRITSLVDFFAALFLLILTWPVFIAAAALVATFDGFPVFYRQPRLGQFGRPFQILKFRTMVRDADEGGQSFAAENDPRITRLGRVLRRLRIDELPQLVNVVRGEMSLVGPRPEQPELAQDLAREIPFYTFRLAVRPGLTGWAQVNTPYARDLRGHRRKLEFDLYYIRDPSLQLYLLTLLRTVNAALVGSRHRLDETSEPDAASRLDGASQEPLESSGDAR